jgi:bile-acid 7alpha-dehydratase
MTEEELQQLKHDVQVLKDIEAVKRVKYAYFRCIDTANMAELKELLHPKIHAKLVGGTYSIEFNTREEYLEMVANSFHAEFVGMHHGHHPEIDILSDTEAKGTFYLQDIAIDMRRHDTTNGSSIYHDKFLKTDGKWQIVDTFYYRVYESVAITPERPPLTAHYLAEHGRKEITFSVTEKYQKQ